MKQVILYTCRACCAKKPAEGFFRQARNKVHGLQLSQCKSCYSEMKRGEDSARRPESLNEEASAAFYKWMRRSG